MFLTRAGGVVMLTQSPIEAQAEAAVFCFHSETGLRAMLGGELPAEGAEPVPVWVDVKFATPAMEGTSTNAAA